MLDYEIYRHHWIFFGLGLGSLLVLLTALSYLAIWRERGGEKKAQVEIVDLKSFLRWFLITFPWVLILTFVATWAVAIIYPFLKMAEPPNW